LPTGLPGGKKIAARIMRAAVDRLKAYGNKQRGQAVATAVCWKVKLSE
jgi:hypothetical protein